MINLLPYEERVALKSKYKRKLLVVAIFAVSFALLPLVIVLGVVTYFEHSNLNIISAQYNKLKNNDKVNNTDILYQEIKNSNENIDNLNDAINAQKSVEYYIEKSVEYKPKNTKLLSFSYNKDINRLTIVGIASSREDIITYTANLNNQKTGICKKINVPVSAYTKKIDAEFVLTCDL